MLEVQRLFLPGAVPVALPGMVPVLGISRGSWDPGGRTDWLRRKAVGAGEAGPPHIPQVGLEKEKVP